MKLVQATGNLTPQFQEIIFNAIDKRQFADVTTAAADTEFFIEHGLGVLPMGFLVTLRDKPGSTYLSTTARDTVKIYLKDSAATVALRVLVF